MVSVRQPVAPLVDYVLTSCSRITSLQMLWVLLFVWRLHFRRKRVGRNPVASDYMSRSGGSAWWRISGIEHLHITSP